MRPKIGIFRRIRSLKSTGPAQRPPEEGPRRDGTTFEPTRTLGEWKSRAQRRRGVSGVSPDTILDNSTPQKLHINTSTSLRRQLLQIHNLCHPRHLRQLHQPHLLRLHYCFAARVASSSNGFSLVRKCLKREGLEFSLPCPWSASGVEESVATNLLTPTIIR